MADLSRKTASIYINHQPAEDALKSLQKQADGLQQKIKAGEEAGKKMVSEITKLGKVQDDIAKVQKQIDSGLRPSFNQVSTTVAKLRNELKKMSEDAPGYADKFKAYQKASLELQRLGDSVSKVNAQQSKLGEFFSGFGGAFALGGIAAAGAALVGFFSDAVGEAAAAEEATARLHNTLDNLGKADAFDRITAQSDRLAESLGYLDNDDINGVFEKLLTYGKLTEAQMSTLAPIIIDFAAKTRTSLPEATDVILKALEGNAKGLKTFGINIKEAGTEAERFGVITTELAGKVDGAAEAFKDTFAGSVATSKQSIADLKEEIGTGLLPVLKFLLSGVSAAIDVFRQFGENIERNIDQLIHFRSNATQAAIEGEKADEAFRKKSASLLAEDFAKKPLEEQRRLFQGAIANMADYEKRYKESITNQASFTKAQLEQIKNNVLNQRENFAAIQDVFINSMQEKGKADREEQEKQNKETAEKNEKLAEANHKKALAEQKRRAEEALRQHKQLEKDFEDLTKTISAATDKLFLSSLELNIKNIEDQNAQQLKKLKELYDKKIIDQQAYNEISIQLERIRSRAITNINTPGLEAIKPTRSTAGGKITAGSGPSAGAIDAAQSNGLPADNTARIFNVEQIAADAQQVLTISQGVFDIVSAFNAAADARDQARIDKRKQEGENEKANAKRLLDGKLIDQDEYNRRVRQSEEKTRRETAKLKKQQFERDKKAQIVSATIMGAQAILSALTLQPFYLGLIMAAIAAGKTIVEINKIKSAKAPEFARGGVLDGPSHSQGGMPVIDPHSGRKVAEMEGGEAILSKRTYRNNRSLVDTLLHSSMHMNGARVQPAWQTGGYFGMNYGALNRSVDHVRRFERGGVFDGSGGGNGGGFNADALLDTLGKINTTMATPQRNFVLLSDVNAGNDTLAQIKNDTVMSRK